MNEHTREPQIDRAATLLSEGNLENHLMYLENVYIASSVPEVSLRLMVRIFHSALCLKRSVIQVFKPEAGLYVAILILINDAWIFALRAIFLTSRPAPSTPGQSQSPIIRRHGVSSAATPDRRFEGRQLPYR